MKIRNIPRDNFAKYFIVIPTMTPNECVYVNSANGIEMALKLAKFYNGKIIKRGN